ncbi:MAG: hypothetical protein JXN10_08240, partial [Clostridia bacterium]|nr:hypothetical protein [Clostridia bacterium]
WKLMDRNGAVWESGSRDAVIEKLSSKAIISLDFTDKLNNMDLKRKTILWYEYTDDAGNISGSSLLFVPNKYFLYEEPGITIDLVEYGDSIGLKLSASSYAGYVCLESSNDDLVFSDNFFSLVPGCEKVVSIEKSSADLREREENIKGDLTVTSIFDSY